MSFSTPVTYCISFSEQKKKSRPDSTYYKKIEMTSPTLVDTKTSLAKKNGLLNVHVKYM